MPFDPKRSCGYVSPPTNNCYYYQDGKHYDLDYNEVDFNSGKITVKAPPKPPVKKAVGPDPVPPPIPKKQQATETAKAKSEVDLVAWVTGAEKYQFFKVKHACTKSYGKTPKNAEEARAIISGH